MRIASQDVALRDAGRDIPFPRHDSVDSYADGPLLSSDQTNVVIREMDVSQFVDESVMPDTVRGLLHIQKEADNMGATGAVYDCPSD